MLFRAVLLLFIVTASILSFTKARAASPDAGQVLQELKKQEQNQSTVDSKAHLPNIQISSDKRSKNKTTKTPLRFTLKNVSFKGNRFIPTVELKKVLLPFLNKEVSFEDLQIIKDKLEAFYRRKGFLAVRIIIPPQKIREGKLTYKILERHLEAVSIEGDADLNQYLKARFAQFTGKPLTVKLVEQILFAVRDFPRVKSVQGLLQKGQQHGGVCLVVRVKPQRKVKPTLSLDNFGSRYTGRIRTTASITFNRSLSTWQTSTIISKTGDLVHGRLSWSRILGLSGWNLGAGIQHTEYRLGGIYKSLKAEGSANNFYFRIGRKLLAGFRREVAFDAQIEQRRLSDRFKAHGIRFDKTVSLGSLGFKGRHHLLGGSFSWRWTATFGSVDFNRDGSDGYHKVVGTLAYQRLLPQGLILNTLFSFQDTDQSLDSSENFTLGGFYGIRAYPLGEASGDRGWLWRTELLNPVPFSSLLTGFFWDVGEAGDVKGNSRTLSGCGLKFHLQTRWKAYLEGAIAWRLTSRATSDKNHSAEVWLKLSFQF